MRDSCWPKIFDFGATDLKLKEILKNPNQEDTTVVRISDSNTGIGSERHAPALTMESEVRNTLRALHVCRRHIFPAEMATEVLLTYLDTSKWLWIYFLQHEHIKNNNAAKVEILTNFIELILRKNAEKYKRHENYLTYDEINTFTSSVITRYKGRNPTYQTPQKRDRSASTPVRQPQVPNKRPNNRPASTGGEPRHPLYNPDGPKGQRFESTQKAIQGLGKRLCKAWNSTGSQPDGSACTNRHSGQGCVSRDNKTWIHKCSKKYDGQGEDGSHCNLPHQEFKHPG